jgi:DNA-binding MarR family transcriptional regulator
MVASGTGPQAEALAHDLYDVLTHLCLTVPRSRRRSGDLKETEYLTLAILQERGTMIVGDIQRLLGVLPAQMSRVIRGLEMRDRPLVTCRINVQDKRKIDVDLTPAGEKALQDFQASRVRRITEVVSDLDEGQQEELRGLLRRLAASLERERAAEAHD